MIFSLIFAVVVAIVAVFFSQENTQMVRIFFFGYPVDGPVGLLLIIAVGIGALVGVILMIPTLIKHSWSSSRQRRQIQELAQRPVRRPAKK